MKILISFYIPGYKVAGNSVYNAVLQRKKSRKVEK